MVFMGATLWNHQPSVTTLSKQTGLWPPTGRESEYLSFPKKNNFRFKVGFISPRHPQYLLRFGVWSVYFGGPVIPLQQVFGCLGVEYLHDFKQRNIQILRLRILEFWLSTPHHGNLRVPPPKATFPPINNALWSGTINHWFPLIIP